MARSQLSLAAIEETTKSPGLKMLHNALASKIKKEDLEDVVGVFLKRAKEGHVGSAQFLLKMLGADAAPTTVIVNNFEAEQPAPLPPPRRVPNKAEQPGELSALNTITVYLSAAGESTPSKIASQTGLDIAIVEVLLDDNPNRFDVQGEKYMIARSKS